jgi:hypothetical protein
VIRHLKTWLLKRRFERLFVKPYQERAEAARKAHARGVRETRQAQQEFLHMALRGRA